MSERSETESTKFLNFLFSTAWEFLQFCELSITYLKRFASMDSSPQSKKRKRTTNESKTVTFSVAKAEKNKVGPVLGSQKRS